MSTHSSGRSMYGGSSGAGSSLGGPYGHHTGYVSSSGEGHDGGRSSSHSSSGGVTTMAGAGASVGASASGASGASGSRGGDHYITHSYPPRTTDLSPLEEPLEDDKYEYTIYYAGDEVGRRVIDFYKSKTLLFGRVGVADIRYGVRDPGKYAWIRTKKGITHTPVIYERRTGRIHAGSKCFDFLNKLNSDLQQQQQHQQQQHYSTGPTDYSPPHSRRMSSSSDLRSTHASSMGGVGGVGGVGVGPSPGSGSPTSQACPHPILVEINNKLNQVLQKLEEHEVFQAKMLAHMSKSNSLLQVSSTAAAASSGKKPIEFTHETSHIDEDLPPSAAASVSRIKGTGKMMAPMVSLDGYKRETKDEYYAKRQESRDRELDKWNVNTSKGDAPIVFEDDGSIPITSSSSSSSLSIGSVISSTSTGVLIGPRSPSSSASSSLTSPGGITGSGAALGAGGVLGSGSAAASALGAGSGVSSGGATGGSSGGGAHSGPTMGASVLHSMLAASTPSSSGLGHLYRTTDRKEARRSDDW